MKRYCLLIIFLIGCTIQVLHAQNLSNRNLFVVRIGDGSTSLTTAATPVYLDEYSTSGTLIRTVAMPVITAGTNKKLTLSGKYAYEGYPVLSPDGESVCLFGYDAAIGTPSIGTSVSSTINRTVGIIDANNTINTSTSVTDAFSAVNARCAVFDGNKGIWMTGGTTGVRYAVLGATISTALTTVTGRAINVFDGQLYMSSTSGDNRIVSVGPGVLPIGGQSVTNLPGYPTTGSPCQFFLADVCNSTPGPDVLYVADNTSGISKYSLVNSVWVSNGKIGTASDQYVGLTGNADNGQVVMYATRKSGTADAGGGELVTIRDNSGLNGAFAATPVLLATAASNTVFRGLCYAFNNADLSNVLPVSLQAFSVNKVNQTSTLNWSSSSEKESAYFEIQRAGEDGVFAKIGSVAASGNSNRKTAYKYLDANPVSGVNYYRLKAIDRNGEFALSDVRFLKFVKKEQPTLQVIYPNDKVLEILINMPETTSATLKIIDMSGKILESERLNLNAGFTRVKPRANLASRTYIATISAVVGEVTTKFVKQ
ncbi:hypothetical protein D3C87_183180 [compost metagenome]